MGNRRVNYSLITAVRKGKLEKVRKFITSLGLSHSQEWSQGYVLLCDALKNGHADVAKLLLTSGSKVNSKSKKPTDTPLHFAVMNNIEIVKMILDKGADVDAKNEYGKTPLHVAAERGYLQIAEHLLDNGANVNCACTGIENDTPLHFAVGRGRTELITLLLSRGANVDAKNQYGMTPLHVAAEEDDLKIAEHLLDNGAYVNCVCTGRQNYTPLHFAVEGGRTEVVTLLLSRGANADAKGEDSITPLHIAAKNGSLDMYIRIAEDLLNHGACIHSQTLKEGYTPLHFASELYDEEIVKLFLSRGADIHARTKDDSTPIHIATRAEHATIVKLLLEHGAKVDNQDENGKTILLIATEKANLTIVKDILKYCPDSNDKSNKNSLKITTLFRTVYYEISTLFRYREQSEQICKALLEYGFIVNQEDANDSELLHAAVEKGYLKIVEDLLKYGADVNALHDSSYHKGLTPLHVAARYKQEEVAKLLISYEADVNAQDETGKTPIFYAIENADSKITKLLLTNRADIKGSPDLLNIAVDKGCMEIVEALLQYGADINATDEYGRTALHFTAPCAGENFFGVRIRRHDINTEEEIAKLLLSKGANVNAGTKDGVTTLHAAAENGHVGVVEALLEYNANVNCKDQNGNTPLHFSVRRGNEKLIMMLLNRGANVNAKRKDRSTALHSAVQTGDKETVKVLLECGAKVDSKRKNSITPLHLAAAEGYQEIIETLLEFGADINSRDKLGRTALYIASGKRLNGIVAILLEYGSDINITTRNDQTPLHCAIAEIEALSRRLGYYGDNHDFYQHHFSGTLGAVAETLKRHIVKMKTANLYVSEKNLLLMSNNDEISNFHDECEREIASMKSEEINNANVSFYDILAKDTSSLARCMRNENIVQVLKLDTYKTKFPIYARMIENNFRKSMERKELLERGNESLDILFDNLPKLTPECIEKIIDYFSDKNLRDLIDACQLLGISDPNTNHVTIP